MKLVIEIHEKDYQSILNSGQVPYGVVYAIMNGTPLPEDPTNGDIFINMFHPYCIKENDTSMWIWYTKDDYEKANVNYTMGTDWWNAPYKRGEEDEG